MNYCKTTLEKNKLKRVKVNTSSP